MSTSIISQAQAGHPVAGAFPPEAATEMLATLAGGEFIITGITVLVLAVIIGYYVVWRVTPALHSPLMSITNAISSVIVVGALIAAGPGDLSVSTILGFIALVLASVNIFGGFIITQRMLAMYRKRKR